MASSLSLLLLVVGSVVTRINGVGTNYALHQPTTQSSNLILSNYNPICYKSDHAVDGNLSQNPNYPVCLCAHTHADAASPAWWQVRLSSWIRVASIRILYRNDMYDPRDVGYGLLVGSFKQTTSVFEQTKFERLYTTTVSLSNSTVYPQNIGVFNFTSLTATGRYFDVLAAGPTGHPVILCELEVYGSPNLLLAAAGIQVIAGDPIYQQRLALNPQALTDEDENTCITVDAGRGFMVNLQFPHTAGSNFTAGIFTDGTVSIDKQLPASDNMMAVAVGTSRGQTDCQLLAVRTSGTKNYHQFACSCTNCSGTARSCFGAWATRPVPCSSANSSYLETNNPIR